MAENHRRLRCRAETVFDVLADGWLYPTWVVGASRMRNVDDGWPARDAQLHHSVGSWPLLLNDRTILHEWDPPRRAVMRARGWPIGEARVTITVEARGDSCVVHMREDAVKGPARLVPKFLANIAIGSRNRETLRRLAYVAEGCETRRGREGRDSPEGAQ